MNTSKAIKSLFSVSCLLALAPITSAASIDLAAPVYPYAVPYGDFYSYSLPVYNDSVDGTPLGDNTKIQPSEPGYVNSSPGELSTDGKYIVIATGTNNQGVYDNSDAALYADNAYQTYEGSGESFTMDKTNLNSYSTHTSADPGGAGQFAGDFNDSWDIDIVDLLKFLENDQGTALDTMAIFFNHNETGSDQALYAWADTWISDASGNSLFSFTGEKYDGTAGDDHLILESNTNAGSDPLNPEVGNGFSEWVYAAGDVCLNGDNITDPPDPTCTLYTNPIHYDHNLGADNAAYVIISDLLNSALDSLYADYKNGTLQYGQWILHTDISMWGEDNGYEQIFIGALSNVSNEIPAPATYLLFALGLLLAFAFRNRPVYS